jgi:hypothetical protein
MSAVAEWFVLRLATAAEIDGWKLIFLILFALMVEEFCVAGDFVRSVFERFDSYSHDLPPVVFSIVRESECTEYIAQRRLRAKGEAYFFVSLRFADFFPWRGIRFKWTPLPAKFGV